jgi:hypothetical protein
MLRNVHLWLPGCLLSALIPRHKPTTETTIHIVFCLVDHYEPDWNKADTALQWRRVQDWIERYPRLAQRHKDADGCYPKHSFFYPIEMYQAEHLEALAGLCRQGYGEVEIHLHHDNDTEEGLRKALVKGKEDFQKHGLLGRHKETGEIMFGFIHGNWCLNNSRKDGRWCGVTHESRALVACGCYADFTFPSAPSETQTAKINSIYYDSGNSDHPKSHDTGIDARVGSMDHKGLLLIQGPLGLNWKQRKWGLIPKIENSDITGQNPPTPDRINLWIRQGIGVKGRPEWVFIKVHTHGAIEKNADALLGNPMDQMLTCLETCYNDGRRYRLHYVTAREMYNLIKAAEAGEDGDPNHYRDYKIHPPVNVGHQKQGG